MHDNLYATIDDLRDRLACNSMALRATAPRDLERIARLTRDRRRIVILLSQHENRLDSLRLDARIKGLIG